MSKPTTTQIEKAYKDAGFQTEITKHGVKVTLTNRVVNHGEVELVADRAFGICSLGTNNFRRTGRGITVNNQA